MSVYKVINLIQADLCKEGITKSSKNTGQGYMFRGIDAVYNTLSPLMAKHGLCVLPRMLTRSVTEQLSGKGTVLFYVVVEAEFDFVCTEDGSKHTVKTFGEAMDSGDKATNKAMSAAYKYAAFQAFAIPTEGDNDADSTTHEVKHIHKPTDNPLFNPEGEELEHLQKICMNVVSLPSHEAMAQMLEEARLDSDEKVWIWDKLDSKTRSGIKKVHAAKKQTTNDEV